MSDKFRIVQVENKFYPQFRPWWWPFWFSMWEKNAKHEELALFHNSDDQGYIKIFRDSIEKAKYCIDKYKAEEADFCKKKVKIIHNVE